MPPEAPWIAVVGAGRASPEELAVAEEVGAEIAAAGAVLVCGGLGGVMEAACRGARSRGGRTVGLLPGLDRSEANGWVEVAVPTGLGEARNAIVVRTADVVIAVHGEFGTLSEIALALKMGKPVVGIGTWELGKQGEPVEAIVRAAELTADPDVRDDRMLIGVGMSSAIGHVHKILSLAEHFRRSSSHPLVRARAAQLHAGRGERGLRHVDVLVPEAPQQRAAVQVDRLRTGRVEVGRDPGDHPVLQQDVRDLPADRGAAEEQRGDGGAHASGRVCQPGAQ